MTKQDAARYFSQELLAWYRRGNRNLPWRLNRDPYRIWVSEIMLQQTKVDTVIPYFHRFIKKFPTVKALAEAREEEVLKCWEGLGYYSRARNLQAGARMVMAVYNGIIPDDKEAIAGLKGVGPYTAGAIMSIAFNRPEPAVDGNVMRVLSRYFSLEEDIAKPKTRVAIEGRAAALIPEGAAGDFNQAMMELGALVCTPKSPSCLTCPVMEQCEARLAGRETELPIKTKAKPPRQEHRLSVIVQGRGEQEGKVLIRQRPDKALLAQMWELPHLMLEGDISDSCQDDALKEPGESAEGIYQMLEKEVGLVIRPMKWFADADHIFSHIHWRMRIYTADLDDHDRKGLTACVAESGEAYKKSGETALEAVQSGNINNQEQTIYRWMGQDEMAKLPFPKLFAKVLRDYWKK